MPGVEAVGGAFISSVIKAVVDTGRSYFADKYEEHKDTQNMLDSLEASLPRILLVLELAECKPVVQDAILEAWLHQLKDTAYEAEDIMDDFEAKRIRESLENKGKVSEIVTSSAGAVKIELLSDNDEMKLKYLVEKMKIISDGVGDLIDVMTIRNNDATEGNKKTFGRDREIGFILDIITDSLETESPDMHMPPTIPDLPQIIVGQNAPKRRIFTLMKKMSNMPCTLKARINAIFSKHEKEETNLIPVSTTMGAFSDWNVSNDITTSFSVGNRSLDVLPIVGMSGVGKTTVAQAIYNNQKVKEHFELCGWVYIADSTDCKRLVHDIVLSFQGGPSKFTETTSNFNINYDKIMHTIDRRRFLLVLDDVREGIDLTWKKLLPVLTEGALGSIVIVTTQLKSVASRIGTLPPISLDVLGWQHFLALFEYHSFGHFRYADVKGNQNATLSQYEEKMLKLIGEEIAKRMHCLPLAAETIGTLLRSKLDKNYWQEILRSGWWNLETVSKNILPSLRVSFQRLDSGLKQCFIYCSLFPKNYAFDKDRLIQMWIAHGFIHPTKAEQFILERNEIKIEDIGISWFNKLVNRFFFQTTVWENRYVMHDLIRELAIAVSTEELYISIKELKDARRVPSFPRHLAIDADVNADVYIDHIEWSEKNIEGLRTIMFFGFCRLGKNKGIRDILYKLEGLRLVDLSYFVSNKNYFLENNIIGHLSYVRYLDLSFTGTWIPNSLCQLVHLQVLDIRGCWFLESPREMNRLISLRHLYVCTHNVSLVSGIGKLTNLQELEEFSVRKERGFTISELMDMNFLSGQLALKILENVLSKEEAISAKLDEKKYLTSLIFEMMALANIYETIKHHQEVLEGLKPHRNIRELTIKKFLWVSFPSWTMKIHEINNLRCVKLIECFQIKTLPPLGSLPKLEVLILEKLISIIFIEDEFYGTSEVIFPSLKELTFSHLWKWEYWSYSGERQLFPCLQKLKITTCYKLLEAPLHCLNSSMVELHLSECDKVIQNVGKYFPAMTCLTQLYLQAYNCMKMNLFCSNLREVRALSLSTIVIDHLEGQISSLFNLRKLSFPIYWEWEQRKPPSPLLTCCNPVNMLQRKESFPSLVCIDVHRCWGIPKFLLRLGMFPSLQTLWIDYCERVEFSIEEDRWFHRSLPSLEDLKLSDCKNLRCLPSSLSTLSSLKKFTLKNCPKICALPQEGLPQSLKELYISQCSTELMQGCKPDTGEEWSKISHVSYIRVGKQTVQYSDDMS